MTAWLTIIGIGEDGLAGLGGSALEAIEQAEILFGGERHLKLIGKAGTVWKSPLEESFADLDQYKGKNVAVIATGDPMWFGIGATLGRRYGPDEIKVIPAPSAFSLVAARLIWPVNDVQCLTVHGRDLERVKAFLMPGSKLVVLANDGQTPKQIADLLSEAGFGNSPVTAFAHMGGPDEARFDGKANSWDHDTVADLNSVAIECVADEGLAVLPRAPGLPDEAFKHDGQLTKREVRAITLSALAPMPGQILWDVGAGCGSISIEWLRATTNARAFAIERNMDRLGMINQNALALGVPELKVVFGEALNEIIGLPSPDAVFIGGGLTSGGLLEYCWQNLNPGGRLVANAVTFEGERRLVDAAEQLGGELSRIEISRAHSMGHSIDGEDSKFTAWKPFKPVTQLRILKT
ncbi:MAG: precorrin-6y C5,15-methyltransferase (decarboxylating) subunit CbiE [Rhodospirillaceae bacterium]|nr:precorrin-6y C5,15-methyltransferase (decarboxylating) subunit CbiE [Rhodospirillaceae bacterium]MBT4588252.1 precorrin-6y C5,15-methyltransferase (decarboxylating) subunit CbiE [Rhodospirillaceae bacterium]MBT4939371.1 precorrin-6y C5,15-methyltransferase (decarboxylating) subunit CbiE [Rhodospirillaceae bacterium]MBT5941224.1 precorrin-6y C5,15-methyltransferase (decarboxylating) subunit CbiE [Rhodospirillaceae bacterium]MBT7265238.1 precorrin-6y C5,15-methyltransferase (decarboxylating) s